MGVTIFKKEDQANGNFNNGEILEKKPIRFSQDGGELKPYLNDFNKVYFFLVPIWGPLFVFLIWL